MPASLEHFVPNLRRVAVTGARGQLGSALCRRLGDRAIPLDRAAFDLDRPEMLAAVLASLRPDAVIHTAAYTQVDRAESEPDRCYSVNVTPLAAIAEACRTLDCPLVQISTDYVFGGDTRRTTPYREDDPTAPQGVYARSKLESERLAAQWQQTFVVRTCGLYGPITPGSSGANFVSTMLRLAREGAPLRVVDDQHCTPSSVADVADAVLRLLGTDRFGTYHVVQAGQTTWFEFATEVFRLAKLSPRITAIRSEEFGARATRPGYSVLDTGKYRRATASTLRRWQDALADFLGGL